MQTETQHDGPAPPRDSAAVAGDEWPDREVADIGDRVANLTVDELRVLRSYLRREGDRRDE